LRHRFTGAEYPANGRDGEAADSRKRVALQGGIPYDVRAGLVSRPSAGRRPRCSIRTDGTGGVALQKNESVVALSGAANRDPAVFSKPDRMDIARPDLRPPSFGGGSHVCLGAQPARIEAEIVFGTLLRRLPAIRLADKGQPQWRQSFSLRGLTSLPVRWD
jgi:cytochrome P450